MVTIPNSVSETGDDRLVNSTAGHSSVATPFGMIRDMLIIISYRLKELAASNDEDIDFFQVPAPNYLTPTPPTTNAINP